MKYLILISLAVSMQLAFAGRKMVTNRKIAANQEQVCTGKDQPWVKEQYKFSQDQILYKYAASLFGEATECSGQVSSVFEGHKFGVMTFKFKNKAILKLESMPPEVSKITLEALNGFNNEIEAVTKVQEAAKNAGLKMTLENPEITKSGSEETKTFWDPTAGVNGRLFLVYRNSQLVNIGYGMAL